MRPIALLSAALLAGATRASAQAVPATVPRFLSPALEPAVARGAGDTATVRETRARNAWWIPLMSTALPGSGQLALGQRRFAAYAVAEAYGWVKYSVDRTDAVRERRQYRALAVSVARAPFGGDFPPGDFEYYERMEHFVESGVFDRVPGGDVEPELDATTYNGSVWLLARTTYWDDPSVTPDRASSAYRSAVAFYDARAVRDAYRWSWNGAPAEWTRFQHAIAESNAGFRRSVEDIGVVIANHALSTVDGYVTVRLRSRRAGSAAGVEGSVPFATIRPRRSRAGR